MKKIIYLFLVLPLSFFSFNGCSSDEFDKEIEEATLRSTSDIPVIYVTLSREHSGSYIYYTMTASAPVQTTLKATEEIHYRVSISDGWNDPPGSGPNWGETWLEDYDGEISVWLGPGDTYDFDVWDNYNDMYQTTSLSGLDHVNVPWNNQIINGIKYVASGGWEWDIKGGSSFFIVGFHSMGGNKIQDVNVLKNEKIARPADPVKSGYKFAGWTIDYSYTGISTPVNISKHWNFDNDIATTNIAGGNRITLYAKWTKQ